MMKNLRGTVFALMSVAMLGSATGLSGQAPPPLRLVSTAWPPFTNRPGEVRFALDLVEEALERIGRTAETTIVDEAAFTPALLSREYDGSAAAWKDAEREEVMVYSAPYLENRLRLVGRRGSDVSATTLGALAGKRVVVVGGYSYGDEVATGSGPTFVQSRSEEDSLAMLLAGKADFTLMDELVVEYILNNHGDEARARLAIGPAPLITRTLHLAIRRERLDAAAIIDRFNAELRTMIADGTYHRLLHVDWIEADVDGDGRVELVAAGPQAGTAPPTRSYDLFTSAASSDAPAPRPSGGPRFYVGGSVYDSWAAVPQQFKITNPSRPDSARSTAIVFRFVW